MIYEDKALFDASDLLMLRVINISWPYLADRGGGGGGWQWAGFGDDRGKGDLIAKWLNKGWTRWC